MSPATIHFVFADKTWRGRRDLNPQVRLSTPAMKTYRWGPRLSPGSLTLSLRPQLPIKLSKTNKKPGAMPGPEQKKIHSDPQHTTPQMTRLVILAITCLKVCCISFTRNYTVT